MDGGRFLGGFVTQGQSSGFPWKPVLIVLGLGTFLCCGGGIVTLVWLGNQGPSGVVAGNQITEEINGKIVRAIKLQEGETVISYFDASFSTDGSEITVLTNRRLAYAMGGRVTQMALVDMREIKHADQGIIGDVITVVADSGERMQVTVPPLNGGPLLLDALQDAQQAARARLPGRATTDEGP